MQSTVVVSETAIAKDFVQNIDIRGRFLLAHLVRKQAAEFESTPPVISP
jgi:hypothetical protein